MKSPDTRQSTIDSAVDSILDGKPEFAGSPQLATTARGLINKNGRVVIDASEAATAEELLTGLALAAITATEVPAELEPAKAALIAEFE